MTRVDRKLLWSGRWKRLASNRKIWGRKVEEASSRNWDVVYIIIIIVGALRYKAESRGFDFRWCHSNFHRHNPSGRTMALGLARPLIEMSTRNISWGLKAAGA